MKTRNSIVSIAWKLILVAIATYGLLDGAGILAGHYDANFPHMFTNISNLFAWGYFLLAAVSLIRHRDERESDIFAPTAKYTATISLLVTMLIAHFMLFDAMFQDGQLVWHLVAMHYVVPVMALLDWVIFDVKGQLPLWGPFAWLSLVVAYLVVVFVGAGVFGLYLGGGTTADQTNYPYTFLDPALSGIGGVIGFVAGMLVAFIVLGFVLVGVDRLLAKLSKRDS